MATTSPGFTTETSAGYRSSPGLSVSHHTELQDDAATDVAAGAGVTGLSSSTTTTTEQQTPATTGVAVVSTNENRAVGEGERDENNNATVNSTSAITSGPEVGTTSAGANKEDRRSHSNGDVRHNSTVANATKEG